MSRLAPWFTIVLFLNLPAGARISPGQPSSRFFLPAVLPQNLAWLLPASPSHQEVSLHVPPEGPPRGRPPGPASEEESRPDAHLVSAEAPAPRPHAGKAPARPDLGSTGLVPGFRF